MDNLARKHDYLYTYSDYITWEDELKVELIDGIVYDMAAPSIEHQALSMELSILFGTYLKGKSCSVFAAPTDVRLNHDKEDNTVVKPDLFVICDKSKLDKRSYNGVPELIIEILSPSNSGTDTITKLNKYLNAGVKEYWVIDPQDKVIVVHLLSGENYLTKIHEKGEIHVNTFENFVINIDELFAVIPTETDAV